MPPSAGTGRRLDWRLEVITGLVAGGAILACALVGILWWTREQIVLAASVGQAEALAGWRREVELAAWALVALALVGAGAFAVVRRHLDARARAEDALSPARRLEAIGQLTGGVAHDVNNLLTIILGSVSLLERDPRVRESEEAVAALKDIDHAGRRAGDLARALLAFARPQPLRPLVVDLNEVVGAVPAMLARLVGPDITVTMSRSPMPLPANVDAAQVETALVNLCVNARDAMPTGGRLAIATRAVTLDADYARAHPGVAPGPYGLITVSDTGTGIAPPDLARIHEPFFTTKEPGKGTGLGLSMVHGFMQQSGGHIRIETEVGRGTEVMLYFPAASEQASAAVERKVAGEPRGRGETVLLVEPDESVRKIAAAALRALAYRVVSAGNGPHALEVARREATLHLLLTDVLLPMGMTGPQLAEQLVGDRPALKVLYASGCAAAAIEPRTGLPLGNPLLAKPYDRRELARAVRGALDAREADEADGRMSA